MGLYLKEGCILEWWSAVRDKNGEIIIQASYKSAGFYAHVPAHYEARSSLTVCHVFPSQVNHSG